MIESIVLDFVFFSLIESFIFCLFFRKMSNIKSFKIREIFLIALVNCFISKFIPPLFYQVIMILFMGFYLSKKKGILILTGMKLSAMAVIYMLLIEMGLFYLYDLILNVDFLNNSYFLIFSFFIPIRIVEILILMIGGSRMKVWAGEIKKRK